MSISDREVQTIKEAHRIVVDIETRDPWLLQYGPGTHRGEGFICGIGVGRETPQGDIVKYLSLTHPDTPVETRDRNKKIAKDILATSSRKLGANIAYDVEWLEHEGYKVNGPLDDIQYAEPLLDEYARSYSLATLGKKYTNKTKQINILDQYANTMGWKGKGIEHIWRMPESVASEYVNMDLILPLEIFAKQKRSLERQNLYELYEMETELIPLLVQMRKVGVRIDTDKLDLVTMQTADMHWNLKKKLFDWAGHEFNPGSSPQLAKIFDTKGIAYPRKPPTEKMLLKGIKVGNPSIDKRALMRIGENHEICKTILDYRHYDTMINMFLHPYHDMIVDGRLYGSFHPLRSDSYGTVSGRFSSSKPNLQQVSAQKEEEGRAEQGLSALKGKILRQLFIPEDGCYWGKLDYSQIEYRMIAHYAQGKGSVSLREQYNHDPTTDFHQYIQDDTGFDRKTAKALNFGGAFGIGVKTASELFGWTMEDAEIFMSTYHRNAPYIRETRNSVSRVAKQRGYIFTLLGRKARTHPSRKLHSMFNRLIQGSAADLFKKSMVEAYKAGVFNSVTPHMFVHDEVDPSIPMTKEGIEATKELIYIMENTVKIDVPVKVDTGIGNNWAEADSDEGNELWKNVA